MAFGGFGNSSNSGTNFGFGASNNNNSGGFGSNNNAASSGSLFGGNTATSGSTFGSGGGFGASNNNTNNAFGANKPATGFGGSPAASGGGGLFGNTASTGGGFGSGGGFGGNTASSNTGFGNSTGGGGLFGSAQKPASTGFGSNTGGSLFGGGSNTNNTGGGFGGASNTASNPFGGGNTNTTGGGFGASTGGGGFGASNPSTGGGFGGGFGASTTTNNNNNGTAAVPFQATNEKDGATSATSAYQSVTFQEPYKNKCFEELRTEDYMQGRRYGNSNGQAGSFGQSTGFGGTNTNTSSGGGLFGSNNNNTATSGGFGANNNATNTSTGFGASNTGGGLFGQSKPAGNSLFGQPAASTGTTGGGFGASTSGNTGGGLFGNSGGGGFGSNNNTSNTGGGGLFGSTNNNNNTQSPFGASTTNNNAGSGGLFGNTANNAQSKPGGLFGSGTNTAGTGGGGLFGQQNNTQQQNSNPFGGSTNNNSTGGGLFGNSNNNAQAKPAFGSGFGQSTNTGGGAFGGGNTNTGGGLFGGSANNNSTGGGLFGNSNNQAKPAGTGGLFGGGNTAQNNTPNTGGGLFGNNNQSGGLFGGGANNNNASNSNSLFGGNNQNKPASGGLFGNSTNTSNTNNNSGGFSLFGGGNQSQNQNNNSTNSGSLFGGNNSNQNNGNSLFGNSQQQSQQPNQLHTSLTVSPYGNDQLFSSLAAPSPPVGPLATPLSGAKPTPKRNQSLLGSVRLNSPVYTPRASTIGRTNGYGLSYSSYGSPNASFSGNLTPGASSLLKPTGSIGSGLASRLKTSFSKTNVRSDGTPEGGSLLRPGALTPSNGRYSSGSMRKLKIDRTLREDLFGSPQRQSETPEDTRDTMKKVNFDDTPGRGRESMSANSGAMVVRPEDEDQDADLTPKSHAPLRKTGTGAQEMEQVNSSGPLSTVPENSAPARAAATSASKPTADTTGDEGSEPGAYWSKPSIDHLKKMSRSQLQKLGKFTVGRHGVGKIEFGPCDLTSVPLDDICGNIVQLNARSATVYLDENDKPPMGQALNVPSTISLEHSWPRSHNGTKHVLEAGTRAYDKHIARLSRINDTQFISYTPETGVWTFKVEHFTTYGLDDDEDDEDESNVLGHEAPNAFNDALPSPMQDETMHSIEAAADGMDDTFEFKLERRSQMSVPGGLDFDGDMYDFDEPAEPVRTEMDVSMEESNAGAMGNSFASSGGPVRAPSPNTMARVHANMGESSDEEDLEPEMPGAFVPEPKIPRSILKPSMGLNAFASPEKFAAETWEEQLQRTMSPKKRDRLALRDMQKSILQAKDQAGPMESPFKQSMLGQSAFGQSYLVQKSAKKAQQPVVGSLDFNKSQAFTTSMDIMNSLWADEKGKKSTAGDKGFEYPYLKKTRLSPPEDVNQQDAEFHQSVKPSFTADGTLAYAVPGSVQQVSGILAPALEPLIGEHTDIRFARVVPSADVHPNTLRMQSSAPNTQITAQDGGVPLAQTQEIKFAALANELTSNTESEKLERSAWQLCSILFDPLDVSCADLLQGFPEHLVEQFAPRMKMDTFAAFWSQVVASDAEKGEQRSKTPEEKALHCLTRNDIRGACDALAGARDIRLAALLSQLPGSVDSREAMKLQIDAWRDRKDWSEMGDAVRALYSIVSGAVCAVDGQSGALEDKCSAFCIAEKFNLSWQQSFGLYVFFGGHASLEDAVDSYIGDLNAEQQTVRPSSRWAQDSEDTLMGLLRLSANGTDVEQLLDPTTVSGSAVDSRLAWQLATVLAARGICSLPDEQMDRLSLDFATELEAASATVTAAWVVLHVSNSKTRLAAMTSLLERNASSISSPDDEEEAADFDQLTRDLQIPASLIWAAKAPYAKIMRGDYLQADWLLKAHQSDPQSGYDNEAHDLLCSSVGPDAIIEQDYENLAALLAQFRSVRKPEGWEQGAQVYADFVRLHKMSATQKQNREGESTLKSLRRGLQVMEEEFAHKTLEQRVAMLEMGRFAEEVAKERGMEYEEDAAMADSSFYGGAVGMLEKYQAALGEVM